MKTATEINETLAHCYGSIDYHVWSVLFPKHALTDGANMLAEMAEAFWLMDGIASYTASFKNEEFQVWTLKTEDGKAVLTGDDGNDNVFVTQEIPHTDFPLPEIKLYCTLGSLDGKTERWIIMLPSEY